MYRYVLYFQDNYRQKANAVYILSILSMFSIGYIHKKTGLSPHVLRVWEKRYQAIMPARSETNRRQYSKENLLRLQLLAELTRNGHKISELAQFPSDKPQALALDDQQDINRDTLDHAQQADEELLEPLVQSIANYDQTSLVQLLDLAIRKYGYSGLLKKIISPLMHKVGSLWHQGNFTTAQEHAATSFIKNYLIQRTENFSTEPHAPVLLATTPSGQFHELGTFFATCHASQLGWHTVYLGPSLPAHEISGAAFQAQASAVLLGLHYPSDDPNIPIELRRIHRQLDGQIPLIIGGAASKTYRPVLDEIHSPLIQSLDELDTVLGAIRNH